MTEDRSDHPMLGGRYRPSERIGRGGMADIFLARDQVLDRPVAVKVLFPAFAGDPRFVARFRREATALARLNHPNIVQVYDWGANDDTYFIVMEYVQGQSLAELLARGPLSVAQATEIVAAAAAGLGYAHRNGIVHRDIKPGNILLATSQAVKVSDFGISQALEGGENLTDTGKVMGTAAYFSPEQAQGQSVGPSSDLYSLGVVLFEMVTGSPPFGGSSPLSVAYKHVHDLPHRASALNRSVPANLGSLIDRLLAKDPDDRYPTASDLEADLRRVASGQPLGSGAAAALDRSTLAPATGMPHRTLAIDPPPSPATEAMPASRLPDRIPAGAGDLDATSQSRGGFLVAVAAAALLAAIAGIYYLSTVLDRDRAADSPTASTESTPEEAPGLTGQPSSTPGPAEGTQTGGDPAPSTTSPSSTEQQSTIASTPPPTSSTAQATTSETVETTQSTTSQGETTAPTSTDATSQ
jgi:serine/threonine-protein kinase